MCAAWASVTVSKMINLHYRINNIGLKPLNRYSTANTLQEKWKTMIGNKLLGSGIRSQTAANCV